MITRLGLGGRQGRGNQMVSWIHILDFCKAVEFIIESENISGPINVTAPNPLSNELFMNKLRSGMKIPVGLNAPVWQLEFASLFLKTETELLLKSRNVYPERLIQNGFRFSYPDIESVFSDLLSIHIFTICKKTIHIHCLLFYFCYHHKFNVFN